MTPAPIEPHSCAASVGRRFRLPERPRAGFLASAAPTVAVTVAGFWLRDIARAGGAFRPTTQIRILLTMSAAERNALARKRKRNGDVVVPIVVSRKSRGVLVDCRWLGEWDEDNREAIRHAVQVMVDNLEPVTRNGSD